MDNIVVVAAKRSAIAKFNGSLKNIPAPELASIITKDILRDIPKDKIDAIFLGNVLQAGNGQNIARQVSRNCDLSDEVMAVTINAVCGSGMQAIISGIQSLKLYDSNICIVGGVENMSQAPFLTKDLRFGHKFGSSTFIDSIQHDALTDAIEHISMIETAENVAKKYHITKKMQDEFAFLSQTKAKKAIENNVFHSEITPINDFAIDEHPRLNTTLEIISKVKPIHESVSAANASGMNDGAAMLILMREQDALDAGLKPLATIENYSFSGCDPKIMGIAPIYAVRKLLAKTNTKIDDYDIIEMTEAFAAQSLAVIQELNIDINKLNVNGGAIALGHPLGASGARLVVSAIHELIRSNLNTALTTLCIGGGNAIALSIKRYERL